MTKIKINRRLRHKDYVVAEGVYSKEKFSEILDRLPKRKQKELMRSSEEIE